MTDIERAVAAAWAKIPADRHVPITDPADGGALFAAPVASAGDVAGAVERARAAAPGWAATPAAERGAALHRAADAVEARFDDLARLVTREMGKPLADALGGVAAGVGTLRRAAELGSVHRGRSLPGGPDATDFMAYTVLSNNMTHAQHAWRALPASTVKSTRLTFTKVVHIGRPG